MINLSKHSVKDSLMFHLLLFCSVSEDETTIEPEMPLCIKKSNRGNPVLVDHDRFEYRYEAAWHHGRVVHWRCRRESKNLKCKARIHTLAAEEGYAIIKKIKLHSCQQTLTLSTQR